MARRSFGFVEVFRFEMKAAHCIACYGGNGPLGVSRVECCLILL
jgi:hypothetical protein